MVAMLVIGGGLTVGVPSEDEPAVATRGGRAVQPATEVRGGGDGAPGRAGAPMPPPDQAAEPAASVTPRVHGPADAGNDLRAVTSRGRD